jgi:LuxR family glucitol operon transcriptional activator
MFTRRDVGYTIISRFELEMRKFISNKLECGYANPFDGIPSGIVDKAKARFYDMDENDCNSLLNESDFPDLSEIFLFKNNFKDWAPYNLVKGDLTSNMSSLYNLRCKIAHVKGNFSALDLDSLVESSSTLASKIFDKDNDFSILINKIVDDPNTYTIRMPDSFTKENNEYLILNNLPTPDYEHDGGFVGREDDKKQITKLLLSSKFPVITLTGAGGVGKTSLALKVVDELLLSTNNKFEAVVWLSAKENMLSANGIVDIEPSLKNYDEMLSIILDVLGFHEEANSINISDKEESINTVLGVVSSILLIVDNLETVTDERITNFIIEAPENIKFLITSRKGIGQIERRHEIIQLKEIEAVYLFRQIAKDKQQNGLLRLDDKTIKNYVNKVSCYPLAIKWLVGQIARGKDINRVIDSIHESTSDISKFCFDQIFNDLSRECKQVLYSLSCLDESPSAGVLEFIVGIEHERFEDAIEELILVSLLIPEQYKNERNEIARKFSILTLTRSYIKQHLSRQPDLKSLIDSKINKVQSTIAETEKARREYRYSLNNIGASTDEEKIAAIYLQTASQKYQLNKYEASVEDYKSAINIAPRFAPIYRNWAVMESQEGHLVEAEKLIEKATSLNSADPQIWLIWGNILKRAQNGQGAVEKYSKAYDIAPEDNIILNAIGQAKSKVGEYKEANDLLSKALEINAAEYSRKHDIITRTNVAENLISWAGALQKDRRYELAQQYLEDALVHANEAFTLDSSDTRSHITLARAMLSIGNLLKRTSRIDLAYDHYLSLSKFATDNAIAARYCALGSLELIKYHLDYGKFDAARGLAKEVYRKHDAVLRRNSYIFEELTHLSKILNDTKVQSGTITRIDEHLSYAIIESHESPFQTYHASVNNFKNLPTGISEDLLSKKVSFIPYITQGVKKEYRKARNIDFIS